MVKFKDYIKESGAYAPAVDVKQYKEAILKQKDYKQIYRGMKDTGNIIVADGNQLERKSANTENYYTLIIDNSPAWKEYPKRSKSFICTTEASVADAYASNILGKKAVYKVIPLENQNIAACTRSDFWFSFQRGMKKYGLYDINSALDPNIDDLSSLNDALHRSSEKLIGKTLDQDTYESFRNGISELEKRIKNIDTSRLVMNDPNWQLFVGAVKPYLEKMDLIQYLEMVLDPKLNFIEIGNHSELKNDAEVWLSGKVLFIKDHLYYDIITDL